MLARYSDEAGRDISLSSGSEFCEELGLNWFVPAFSLGELVGLGTVHVGCSTPGTVTGLEIRSNWV